jgi:hypothetical protein
VLLDAADRPLLPHDALEQLVDPLQRLFVPDCLLERVEDAIDLDGSPGVELTADERLLDGLDRHVDTVEPTRLGIAAPDELARLAHVDLSRFHELRQDLGLLDGVQVLAA